VTEIGGPNGMRDSHLILSLKSSGFCGLLEIYQVLFP